MLPSFRNIEIMKITKDSQQFMLSKAVWTDLIINGKLLSGITYFMLESNDSWCSYWMKMDSDCRSVLHRHTDVELIMLLVGTVQDSTGVVYEAGDCVVYRRDSEHQLYAQHGCIMLVVESRPPIIY
ncbi:hypothetical protein ASF84_18395 [Pseudomonas sp. Leaf127]|nr:hypothetical protein ASF84_18395 [Pseudomonas sp. Leaf127]